MCIFPIFFDIIKKNEMLCYFVEKFAKNILILVPTIKHNVYFKLLILILKGGAILRFK